MLQSNSVCKDYSKSNVGRFLRHSVYLVTHTSMSRWPSALRDWCCVARWDKFLVEWYLADLIAAVNHTYLFNTDHSYCFRKRFDEPQTYIIHRARVGKQNFRRRFVASEIYAKYFFLLFIMVALWNRADHYIFIRSFVLSILFSSPNLSRARLDVCHTSTHGVALVRI